MNLDLKKLRRLSHASPAVIPIAVISRNIQILLLTKVAKLTPAINELSVSIYSQLKPCGHHAITDAHYYGQNPDPRQKLCCVLLNKRPKTPA